MSPFDHFISSFDEGIKKQDLQKLTLSNYKGPESELKNVYIKLVLIKRELMLSFVYRYKTKDVTKNFNSSDALATILNLTEFKGFRNISLQRTNEILHFQRNKKGDWMERRENVKEETFVNLLHDKQKERKITDLSKPYLQSLNLTDASAKVYKSAQDKWKQINHYIEILSSSLAELPKDKKLNIVDMGAGKGYLTFALYDYLKSSLQQDVLVNGVEFREDLVEFCNQVAKDSAFDDLHFVQGTIENYKPEEKVDVLIALHACDTATDDAIYKGLQDESALIVVAPCCHKQVRRELEKFKAKNELDFMLKYGIFLERHAEMLTDSIRALVLEYYGYETRVMQFISDQHTPKNVMIVGLKKEVNPNKQTQIREKLKSIQEYFGIGYHHLVRLCGLDR
ncbi:class I SAM-dependent methyltransferase [Sphingobacterium sp. 1.A.4]|uniref:class I SAM-dependent methyltransferase n=1 Tax=Sphingobacterium sp. 1.A.4 TaxID=2044603 RepID=UPI000C0BC568|nr:SAM-dependent methyltransferase [Sphingobacterium sp. 1.A.4]